MLLAGALVTLSLAPFDVWPLGIIASGLLALSLQNLSPKQTLRRAFTFGLGLFGTGTSWVYISIHDFAYTPMPLAVLMTASFVAFLALIFALPFYVYSRFIRRSPWGMLLGFPCIWVLGEWSRSWFLTGFPWMYLGYAHVETWLGGWAPVLGVYGLSFFTVLSGTALASLVTRLLAHRADATAEPRAALKPIDPKLALILIPVILTWTAAAALKQYSWTQAHDGKAIDVALIQPNIPLELKWDASYASTIVQILRERTEKHWSKDLIIWPEAAVPYLYQDALPLLESLQEEAQSHQSGLITGIIYDDHHTQKYYNAVTGLGTASGLYFKQRLVPFGEYVPLESWLRDLMYFFNLPQSLIHAGPRDQSILSNQGYNISSMICYEIVYPDLVARLSRDSELMLTISNDAWFGDSIGPLQHFQMAQMRALENQRYMIRATNNGLSGVIGPDGKIIAQAKSFVETDMSAQVQRMQGLTPYARTGSLPFIGLLTLLMLIIANHSRIFRTSSREVDDH